MKQAKMFFILLLISSCGSEPQPNQEPPEILSLETEEIFFQKIGLSDEQSIVIDLRHNPENPCEEYPDSYWELKKESANFYTFHLINMCYMRPPYGEFEFYYENYGFHLVGQINYNGGLNADERYKFDMNLPIGDTLKLFELENKISEDGQTVWTERHFKGSGGTFEVVKENRKKVLITDFEKGKQYNLSFEEDIFDIHHEDLVGIVLKPDHQLPIMHVIDRNENNWFWKKSYFGEELIYKNKSLDPNSINYFE